MEKSVLINHLLVSYSPSGFEHSSTEVFQNELLKSGLKFEFIDSIGNCAFSYGNGNVPFMLSGHIDEIGMQVQYIDEDGFIHFIADGGIDPKTLPGAHVSIMSHNRDVQSGVIGKTPIHIEHRGDDKDKAIKIKDLKIDIGAENKEQAEKLVSVGDLIVINHHPIWFNQHRFSSGGCDDKVGVFITMEVMRRLQLEGIKLNSLKVYGVACTQEEVGGYGAAIAAKRINPQYSIDYDVTFATDDGTVRKEEWGDIKLGKGGCIAFGPDKNREIANDLIGICNELKIPYQTFSVGAGMTNTAKIELNSSDCKTQLLSIPQRNMHTPAEVCDFRDVESLIEMTFEYIKHLDGELSH